MLASLKRILDRPLNPPERHAFAQTSDTGESRQETGLTPEHTAKTVKYNVVGHLGRSHLTGSTWRAHVVTPDPDYVVCSYGNWRLTDQQADTSCAYAMH